MTLFVFPSFVFFSFYFGDRTVPKASGGTPISFTLSLFPGPTFSFHPDFYSIFGFLLVPTLSIFVFPKQSVIFNSAFSTPLVFKGCFFQFNVFFPFIWNVFPSTLASKKECAPILFAPPLSTSFDGGFFFAREGFVLPIFGPALRDSRGPFEWLGKRPQVCV